MGPPASVSHRARSLPSLGATGWTVPLCRGQAGQEDSSAVRDLTHTPGPAQGPGRALTGPPCSSLPAPAHAPRRQRVHESCAPHRPAAPPLLAPGLRLPAPEGHCRLLLPQGRPVPKLTGLHPVPPPRPRGALSLPRTPSPWPQREKKRTLFLYNDLLRKRAAFTQLRRAAILRRARLQKAPVSPGLLPVGPAIVRTMAGASAISPSGPGAQAHRDQRVLMGCVPRAPGHPAPGGEGWVHLRPPGFSPAGDTQWAIRRQAEKGNLI